MRLHANVALQLWSLPLQRLGTDADGVETAFSVEAPPGVARAAGLGGAAQYSTETSATVSAFTAAVTLLVLLAFVSGRPFLVLTSAFLVVAVAAALIVVEVPSTNDISSASASSSTAPGRSKHDSSKRLASAKRTARRIAAAVMLPGLPISDGPPLPVAAVPAAVAQASLELPPEAAVLAWEAVAAWASGQPSVPEHRRSLARRGKVWVVLEAAPTAFVTAPLQAFLLVPHDGGLLARAYLVLGETKPAAAAAAEATAALRRLLRPEALAAAAAVGSSPPRAAAAARTAG